MTEIGFYHCTKAAPEEVALKLMARVWETRERLLVVAEAETLDVLDRRLWTDPPNESFLPHGVASDEVNAPDQPILLSQTPEPLNAAPLLMLVDRPLVELPAPFTRILHLFADGSAGHVRAREEWKSLNGLAGVSRTYWQQDARGRWEKRG
jgi:DNA polymerase-3 subunit chi